MTTVFRLFFLFVWVLIAGQSWSAVSPTSVIYTYDAVGNHLLDRNSVSIDKESGYGGKQNLHKPIEYRHAEITDGKAQIGPFFALVDGLVATKGGAKSIQEQVLELKKLNNNKNTVTV